MQLRRVDGDTFQLDLLPEEGSFLVALCEGLRARLLADAGASADPDLVRLSPPAHADDEEVSRQYRQVVGDELLASRLAALDAIVRTAGGGTVTREDLERWLRGLNALRLVLGTALGVGDDHDVDALDPDDPDLGDHLLYADLGAVMGLVLHALATPGG